MSKVDTKKIAPKWRSLLFPVSVVLYVCACIAVRRAAVSGQHLMAYVVVAFMITLEMMAAGIV